VKREEVKELAASDDSLSMPIHFFTSSPFHFSKPYSQEERMPRSSQSRKPSLFLAGATSLVAASLALLSGTAAAEHALFTPPLFPDGSNQLDCYILNVSDETREARIEVFTKDGERVGHDKVSLAPGTEKVVTVPANLAPRYCKFEVDGKRSNFRASILVREPGRGSISALPAE
jgi:hypothetical protein